MPNTDSTLTNPSPKMPFHFIPQAKSHLSDHIDFIHQALAKVDIETARKTALGKFKQQSTLNLPEGINDPLVAAFLNPENHKGNEFEALKKEYGNLQKLHPNHSITGYVDSVQKVTQHVNRGFNEFLKKEKETFHNAYKEVCTDEGKRKELWEMYAKNLRTNIQAPLEQFTKEIDDLVPQALIHYVNRLGQAKQDPSNSGRVETWAKEKLDRKLQYPDQKGKPITITNDKQTGNPSEIRIDPMSSLFGSSGDIGDAYAILVASHGKDVPIKIVVPTFDDDNIYVEMRDFIALLIFLIFSTIFKHLENKHYLEAGKQAAKDKGISLDNIVLVNTKGNQIKFSKKDKEEVSKKLEKLESEYLAGIPKDAKELGNKDSAATTQEKEESQNQQPSMKLTVV